MIRVTRERLWFGAFVLLVFVMGLAAGIAVDRYTRARPEPPFGRGPLGGRPPAAAVLVERLDRELNLSADQQRQLESVLQRNRQRMQAFQASTREEFETLRRELDAEIRAILTPEQRAKFDERASRRRRPFPGGGMP